MKSSIWEGSDNKSTEFDFFKLMEEKELLVSCNCKSEVLSLVKYDNEEEIYLTVYKYYSVYNSFFARLKMAWKVLTDGKVDIADVVLSKENFEKIKQF